MITMLIKTFSRTSPTSVDLRKIEPFETSENILKQFCDTLYLVSKKMAR